jgi:hypothetical protein
VGPALNKESGAVEGRIWIDQREPDYVLDPLTDTVFLRKGRKGIYAVR